MNVEEFRQRAYMPAARSDRSAWTALPTPAGVAAPWWQHVDEFRYVEAETVELDAAGNLRCDGVLIRTGDVPEHPIDSVEAAIDAVCDRILAEYPDSDTMHRARHWAFTTMRRKR